MFLMFSVSGALAQNMNNINPPVQSGYINCRCSDTAGRLFVTFYTPKDTTDVYMYDPVSKLWSLYTQLPSRALASPVGGSCAFVYSQLIIAATEKNNRLQLYRVPFGFSQSLLRTSRLPSNPYSVRTKMVQVGKTIYIDGSLDTGNNARDTMFAFSNSVLSKIIKPVGVKDYSTDMVSLRDTLFMSHNKTVYKYDGVGSWISIPAYSQNNRIISLAANSSNLYIATEGGDVSKYDNYTFVNQVQTKFLQPVVSLSDTGVYVVNRATPPETYNSFGSINFPGKFRINFNNRSQDSFEIKLTYVGNYLFADQWRGMDLYSGTYGGIGSVRVGQLDTPQTDVVQVGMFLDYNKSGFKDQGEPLVSGTAYDSVAQKYLNLSNDLSTSITQLDNIPIAIKGNDYSNAGKCYAHAGPCYASRGYRNSQRNRDTIYIPMVEKPSGFNLFAYATASPQARLNQSTALIFRVGFSGCNTSPQNNEKLVVVIDSGAVINGSQPIYSRKYGRTLEFDNPNFGGDNFIKVFVTYPTANFKIGDKAIHRAKLIVNDQIAEDNVDSVSQTMRYSYDPNIKVSVPQGVIKEGIRKVRYTIHFQNEGNDDAWRVTVVDTMQFNLPVYTFKMVGASHKYSVSATGAVVTWVFDNIMLKPKSVNEDASKGYLSFDAYLAGDLGIGQSIINRAAIYFDYNEPIITNAAMIKRDKDSEIPEISLDQLSAYPNPFNHEIRINNTSSDIQLISVYASDGKFIGEYTIESGQNTITLPDHAAAGVYLFVCSNGSVFRMLKVNE